MSRGFTVSTKDEKIKSINRTIRFKPEHFDRIVQLSEETGVSFNKIVNQCLAFALDSMEDPSEDP